MNRLFVKLFFFNLRKKTMYKDGFDGTRKNEGLLERTKVIDAADQKIKRIDERLEKKGARFHTGTIFFVLYA